MDYKAGVMPQKIELFKLIIVHVIKKFPRLL
jgi:hypothetical protein